MSPLEQEIADLKRVLWLAAHSAGGKLRIKKQSYQAWAGRPCALETATDFNTGDHIVEVIET
ncbi:hypothetical protein [Bradyrhizobium ottawaense]|uniref:hypothetical protein n=1 Tax=Bradyrhizobium ottawaense TaxID=931866 RepID=UPI00383522D4